jgi:chromatin segregation and condensation protein Rec8/ScpA/Scc1 (kleisin family)
LVENIFVIVDQQEVIVMFLAVLHMLANKLASVEQGEAFGDIIVKKSDQETAAEQAPVVSE